MDIKIFKTAEEASKAAAEIFKDTLKTGQEVFGLATGSTPEKTYEILVESDLDFSNAIAINLDEYYGIASTHDQSYAYFMNQHLFQHKPFKETHIPNGENTDAEDEVTRYDAILEKYPRDLQILGIGSNGHIAFNEPGSSFDATTTKVKLTDSTIQDNSRFFDNKDEVPQEAYSMGIKSIMDAKHIILMAFGESKADAIKKIIKGPVTEDVPASVLQKHPNVTLLLDEAVASKLSSN